MILHVLLSSSLVIRETSWSELVKQSSGKKIFNSSFLTVELLSGSLGASSATQTISTQIKTDLNYVQG